MIKPSRVEKEEPPSRRLLDLRFGYTLLLDRRVPVLTKGIALTIGLAVVGLMELLELPIEEFIALALPFVGILGDVMFAGMEAILGPVLIACLLLPHLSPAAIVEQIRNAQSNSPKKPIIDI
jgi:hypothetical protein